MGFIGTYRGLAEAFQGGRRQGPMDAGLVLHARRFLSAAQVPWTPTAPLEGLAPGSLESQVDQGDDCEENRAFPYRILAPTGLERGTRGVILLHGLNEKKWEKYLPWAKALAEGLRAPVILFPIAFHMERSPALWFEPRPMRQLSRDRQSRIPGLEQSYFANAALSSRLHARPERFLWAGLRTLEDVVALSQRVRQGEEPLLAPDARLDFFGYSIGAFLSELLLLSDVDGRFSESRVVSFCGGCVLSRQDPLAREILDSAAAQALRHFLLKELEPLKQVRPELSRLFSEHPAGRAFELMVSEEHLRAEREEALRRVSSRIQAIALQEDRVAPPGAVADTFAGTGVRVDILAPPYAYEHVNPFPAVTALEADVERSFADTFGRAVEWLAR
jgi:hypothetical protein